MTFDKILSLGALLSMPVVVWNLWHTPSTVALIAASGACLYMAVVCLEDLRK